MNKREFLEFWNVDPDSAEGEELWNEKVAMMEGRHMKKAPMIFVSPDIHYKSPIDGRPITNKSARLDDLARNNCVEYDPEMKTDYKRRIAESEKKLDKSVDEQVEKTISQMPSRKRERLEGELRAGLDAEVVRTAPSTS